MNMAQQQTQLRGKLLMQESMARYTSWRVGGPAERFYEPADRQDLLNFIAGLPTQEPVLFIGLGSNLLVRDGGIKGTVVRLQGCLDHISLHQQTEQGGVIYAEAGVNSAQLARFAAKQGLKGGEFFAGIPGTVGGALAMNAGAFGSETWEFVQQAETAVYRRLFLF
jgi:UDP-N-acetylmuramate dehydrogenase